MKPGSLKFKLLVVLTALIFIGLTVSAIAGKPGNTGSQSVATLGISLRVPSSVRARQVSIMQQTQHSRIHREYLCLEITETRKVSLYVLAYHTDGSQTRPVSHWSTDDLQTRDDIHQPENCQISVPLDLPDAWSAEGGPITLIVSPE